MNDMRLTERAPAVDTTKISAKGVNVHYGGTHALKDVSVDIGDRLVTAFIGPSGCGKSTFLRCLNRMNDTIGAARRSEDSTIVSRSARLGLELIRGPYATLS